MKVRSVIAMISCAATFFSIPLDATTCVAGKSFKVPQLCGTVTDKDGAVIPDAKVQITRKGHSGQINDASSDKYGSFVITNVADGE